MASAVNDYRLRFSRPSPDLNAVLFTRGSRGLDPLRIGVLVRSEIEPWAAEALRLLLSSPAANVELIADIELPEKTAVGGALFRRHLAWSTKRSERRAKAQPEPHGHLPVPRRLASDGESGLAGATLMHLRQLALDVVIWLDSSRPEGDCEGVARYGLWSFCFGDLDGDLREPPYYWEPWQGQPIAPVALLVHRESCDWAYALERYFAAARPSWYISQNHAEPLTMARFLLERRLWDLAETRSLPAAAPASRLTEPGPGPSNAEAARCLARLATRSVRGRLHGIGRSKPRWISAVRSRPASVGVEDSDTSAPNWNEIPTPVSHAFADPFIITWDGKTAIFVEDVPPGPKRGQLLGMEVSQDGLSESFSVVEKHYHMSYPCVFEANGAVFMIPETAENRTVDLYRATDFPRTWVHEHTLIEGVDLVDTTPFFHDDTWYFFTSPAGAPANHSTTFLFFSSTLTGEWIYHPCNPICEDVRRARSAGHLWWRHGKLLRPAQDCSVGYGHAIQLNEVLSLSPTDYQERHLETISPSWRRDLIATHTLNSAPGMQVIDGLTRDRSGLLQFIRR